MAAAADVDAIKAAMTNHLEEYNRAMVNIREEMTGVQARIRLLEDKGPHDGRGRIKDAQHLMPEKWTCEKDGTFNDFAHDLMTYMAMINREARDMMEQVLKKDGWKNLDEMDDAEYPNKEFLDDHLYATLSKVMKGEAKAIVRNAGGSGFKAWHSLHKHYTPKTTTDAPASIQKLISPHRVKDAESTKMAIEKFETDV